MPCTLSAQPQKSKVSRKKQELLDAQNTKLVEKKKHKVKNAQDDEKELVEMR